MWRAGPKDQPRPPDLLVFDLDPGLPATITQCCQVALLLRDRAARTTSSSSRRRAAPRASSSTPVWPPSAGPRSGRTAMPTNLAEELEHSAPDLAVSRMAKSLREGRVFIDWSQNNGAKTTVSPYSLRRPRPPDGLHPSHLGRSRRAGPSAAGRSSSPSPRTTSWTGSTPWATSSSRSAPRCPWRATSRSRLTDRLIRGSPRD